MNNLQKIGGIAALIEATTYIVGFGLGVTLFADYFSGELNRAESVAFLVDNQTMVFIWNFIIYIINGIFLVVLVQALHNRLKDSSPVMAQTATAFGLIWAGLVIASGMLIIVDLSTIANLYETNPTEAEFAWQMLSSVEEGLGGGIEMVGGIWVLLVSLSAWNHRQLPKGLNILGSIIGIAGIITVIPILTDFGAIFGLGFVVWFLWVGIILLRQSPQAIVE